MCKRIARNHLSLVVLTLLLSCLPYQAQAQPEMPNQVPCVEGAEVILNFGDRTQDCRIEETSDTDTFRFSATAGDAIRVIVVDNGSTSFGTIIEVFDPTGRRLIRTPVSVTDLTLDLTGDYLLIISDSGFNAIGDYTVGLERFPDVAALPVIPDAPPPGFPDGPPLVTDTIDYVSDLDFFRFTGTAGETLRFFVLDNGSTSFGTNIEIFDPTGRRLIRTPVSTTDLTLDLTGDYMLIISDSGFDAIGDYEITLECVSGECPTDSRQPVASVEVIGVVPGVFTTDGGTFDISIIPRDANGKVLTDGVTAANFSFQMMQAELVADTMMVTPASATEVTGVEIRGAEAGEPVTLVLDFDSSGSMTDNDPERLRVEAGKQVLPLLTAEDQAAILDFGAGSSDGLRASRLLQNFTSDITLLNAAIEQVTADGGTPLFDSLLDAFDLIETQAGSNPAVVVLTDGEDNDSSSTPADVITRATALNTPVCPIGLGQGVGIPPLQTIAGETGCTFASSDDATALEAVFQQITRGLLEGRVVVMGAGRFAPALQVGLYRISGVLVTAIDGAEVETPFKFPVDVVPVSNALAAMEKGWQRPHVPYSEAEESQR